MKPSIIELIDWVRVLHPSWHKIHHFEDITEETKPNTTKSNNREQNYTKKLSKLKQKTHKKLNLNKHKIMLKLRLN